MRNAVRFTLAALVLLVLIVGAFCAGFGTAYLLAENYLLPSPRVTVPPTTPPPTVATETAPAPTATPLPTVPLSEEDQETFQLFWEVWGLVQQYFYGDLPDMQQVTYAAIHGMLNSLDDPYTAFIEPQAAAIIAEDATGEFQGIGAYVEMDEESGKVIITGVFEGGPAEKAGLQEGDLISEVDGVSIVGKTLYEAIGLIRGPAGTSVTLLVEREGVDEPFEVTVVRAKLEIPIVEYKMLDDGVGYISLREFSATAEKNVREALEDLLSQEPVGIVLDLRQNPGGWLDQAIGVADLFLDDGTILIERWSDGQEKRYEAHPGDVGEEVPLVVLVNGGSASASEIVAGALQDRERATLIGETTFGKGSVQRPFTLGDGSELRVTIARWFTPNDRAIHGRGITPDIVVPWPEDAGPDEDPQLDRAVEYLLIASGQ